MLGLAKVRAEKGGIELREFPEPSPGADEILLRVKAAGICGTDLQIYNWAPRMARRMQLPCILGHEISGIIEQVGAEVKDLIPGQSVVLESHIFCGTCTVCRLGKPHLCENLTYPGVDRHGGFAPLVAVPARIARLFEPSLGFECAAMMEPLGIAVHACQTGEGVAGKTVLVNGCGPIGLMNVAVARALGAETIFAADLAPGRLAVAKTMGADCLLNPDHEDVVARVRALTGGAGVEVVFEYTATARGFEAAVACLMKGGALRLVAAPAEPLNVDFTKWVSAGYTVANIHGRRLWQDWDTLQMLLGEGRVDLQPLLSHVLPLEEAVRGFELALSGQALKPVVVPAAG